MTYKANPTATPASRYTKFSIISPLPETKSSREFYSNHYPYSELNQFHSVHLTGQQKNHLHALQERPLLLSCRHRDQTYIHRLQRSDRREEEDT